MFLPEFYIAAIGLGGVAHAIKTFGLARLRNLGEVAQRILVGRSLRTFFNMFVTLGIGITFGWLIRTGYIQDYEMIFGILYLASFLLITEWIIMYNLHISDEQAAFLRGLLKRGRMNHIVQS